MSQLGGPNSENIGGVHFTVGAVGAEQAAAQVDKAAASVQNLGDTAQTAGAKVNAATGSESGGGIKGFTAGLKGATKPFRDLFGLFSSFIGIATRTIGIIGLVTGAFAGLVAALKAYQNWLTDADAKTREAAKSLDAYKESLEKIKSVSPDNELKAYADALERISALQQKLADLNTRVFTLTGESSFDIAKRLRDEIALERQLVELLQEKAAARAVEKADAKAILEFQKSNYEFENFVRKEKKKAQDDEMAYRAKWQQHEKDFLDFVAREKKKIADDEMEALQRLRNEYNNWMMDFKSQQASLFTGRGGHF